MFKGSFSAMRLVWGSLSGARSIMQSFAKVIGIPGYFILAATTILVLFITFTIIRSVLRIGGG
jgi:hypothetical protein